MKTAIVITVSIVGAVVAIAVANRFETTKKIVNG